MTVVLAGRHDPLVVTVGVFYVINALGALLTGSLTPILGSVTGYSVSVTIALGGALIVGGALWPRTERTGRAVERAGHYLAVAGWLSFALALWAELGLPAASLVGAQAAVLALGSAARAHSLRRVEKAVTDAETAETVRYREGDT